MDLPCFRPRLFTHVACVYSSLMTSLRLVRFLSSLSERTTIRHREQCRTMRHVSRYLAPFPDSDTYTYTYTYRPRRLLARSKPHTSSPARPSVVGSTRFSPRQQIYNTRMSYRLHLLLRRRRRPNLSSNGCGARPPRRRWQDRTELGRGAGRSSALC
jgi:hypothetical protein